VKERLVTCNEEDKGGRARVTRDEERLFYLEITMSFCYRAMHFSAKRGIAIACRLSVCLSVCNIGGL